eukprot:CAMPEP_0206139918 /NCGR_PEP_ID=MMETSP1473-20131121/7810_1 /ASSEMBLY_ACC=CAM_ASM_001109 /TAXON_ID=1461547 /ORGANISM="Stichococcus sp, Strain RCC1054" /LENGTH=70 /DNA_ID=CAMNT_0053533869 /DNA_START=711 /DNA_END=923 /DNA_ORIENTATION=-
MASLPWMSSGAGPLNLKASNREMDFGTNCTTGLLDIEGTAAAPGCPGGTRSGTTPLVGCTLGPAPLRLPV